MFSRLRQTFSNKRPGLDLPLRQDVPGDEDMDELEKARRDLLLAALEGQRSSARHEGPVTVGAAPINPPTQSPVPVPEETVSSVEPEVALPTLSKPAATSTDEQPRIASSSEPHGHSPSYPPPSPPKPVATSTNDQPRIPSSNLSSRPAAKMSKNGSGSSATLRERTIDGIMKEIVMADIAAEKQKLARNAQRDR